MKVRTAVVAILASLAAVASHAQDACYWVPGQGGIYYDARVTAGVVDGLRIADGTRFPSAQDAIDDLGSTAGLVIIPPEYAGAAWADVTNLPSRVGILDVSGKGGFRVGNAPMVLRFKFDDGWAPHPRIVGMMVRPSYGHMTDPLYYYTPFNVVQGDDTGPVPAGTKGQLGGYEQNMVSAQAASDLAPAEANHPFGATLKVLNGAATDVIDAVLIIENTAANTYGLNFYVEKNAPGGTQYLIHPQSGGAYPVTAGISLDHLFAVDGIRAGGHTIVGVSQLGVGTDAPASAVHVAAGDVAITGQGGGLVLRSDTGACYRVTVTGAGGLATVPTACPQ